MSRQALLHRIADQVLDLPGLLKVGIDGVDGAGKTHFADELQLILAAHRPVIRAGVDGFHQPRARRYARGRGSPEGFYLDSYDYDLLKACLLEPIVRLEPIRTAAFDHVSDQPVDSPWQTAAPDAILLFDGIFLHRPELVDYWDFSIFLQVDFAVSIPRGAQRGTGSPDPAAESNRRYIEGQKLYLSRCEPCKRASLVIDNNDLEQPTLLTAGDA